MSLLHIKIAGYELDDSFVVKIIIGGLCGLFLLLLIGQTEFSDWVLKSLVVWIGVTIILIPILYMFIEEMVELKHLVLISIGVAILVLFSIYGKVPSNILFINILQSIVWMTIFSIILDFFKNSVHSRVWRGKR